MRIIWLDAVLTVGKLADNDLVALNPSVSRRHAALVVLKGGHVLLIDLKSKAKTFKWGETSYVWLISSPGHFLWCIRSGDTRWAFRNGSALEYDHVGVLMQTNDSFSVGASSRHYLLEVRCPLSSESSCLVSSTWVVTGAGGK